MGLRWLITRLNNWYHYPLVRGSISYALTWTISTLLDQTLKNRECEHWDQYEWYQVKKMAFYGGVIISPCVYGWTTLMDLIFPNTSLRVTVAKGLLDQITFAPIGISLFYIATSILDGEGWQYGVAELRGKFFVTYTSGCFYWPIMRTINYRFVTWKNRVAFMSLSSLLWSTYLLRLKYTNVDCFQFRRKH